MLANFFVGFQGWNSTKFWGRMDICIFGRILFRKSFQIGQTISWRLNVSRNCPKAWPPQKLVTDSQTTKKANSRCFIPSSTHGLINYTDTKAKCRHLTNKQRDFAAGVYQSLSTGDTVSHVGIFDPALWNCCSSNLLSGSTLPLSPSFSEWISILYTRIQCVGGGCMRFWASDK